MNTGIQDAHNLAWKLAAGADSIALHNINPGRMHHAQTRHADQHHTMSASTCGLNCPSLFSWMCAVLDACSGRFCVTPRMCSAAGQGASGLAGQL